MILNATTSILTAAFASRAAKTSPELSYVCIGCMVFGLILFKLARGDIEHAD